ncbi:MAG: AAA family ATPase, partial [Chloroflexi bacterium]|nr:AAA family ATPase [Chloroflexota bacterium]
MQTPRLYFLGAPKFELHDSNVELNAAKAVALVGYLAATREPQTRDHILGLLWASSAGEAARKNLRNTLWQIRKTLGDDILADDNRLAIAPATWVDVWEYQRLTGPGSPRPDGDGRAEIERLKAAATLYRGPFLDGLIVADAPEFEIWLTGERERLGQLNLRTLATLVDAFEKQNDWRAAIDAAQLAVALDELQEPMYRAIMRAHARLGERAQALHAYDQLSAELDRELGVPPLPETQALRDSIVAGTFSSAPAAPLRVPAPSEQPAGRTGLHYIGRRVERATLDAELDASMRGDVRVVLVTGEVGIGKSRLWQEWFSSLTPSLTVLAARCLDSTQGLPFAPLTELFSRSNVAERLFGNPSPVPPVWLSQVARLLPDIRRRHVDLSPPPNLPDDEERRRLFEAFVQCLLAIETRPTVLFVDDVHWADRATLDWLGYLVHRLQGHALLLVTAYRSEDAPAALVHLTAGWTREGIARRLPLARLTNAESAALIVSLGGNPALADRVHSQTAGNPYFLIELIRAGTDQVPPALTELIRGRVDRLPESARQVLQAAAVLAPEFDFATLRRTSGRGEEETRQALDALLSASVLVEHGTRYEFSHPLVATVVADSLSGARRAFLNRRAAEALEAIHAGRLPQIAGQLTAHYVQAGDAARAARYAEMAAERALALAAAAEAVNFYRQAISLEATPKRRFELGRVLLRQGELAQARDVFQSALREAQSLGDRRCAGRAALGISETFFPQGRFDEARHWIEQGIALMDEEGDVESHAMAHYLLGSSPGDDAEMHLSRAFDHARENNLPELAARSRFALGTLLAERGELERAIHAYRESIELAQTAGDEYAELLGYNNLAYHLLLAGDVNAARENVDRALALAGERAIRLPLQYLYSTRGEIALAERQWDQAESWFKRAVSEAEANGNSEQAAGGFANLGLAAQGRGDLDEALMLLESARDMADKLDAPHFNIRIALSLAELYL